MLRLLPFVFFLSCDEPGEPKGSGCQQGMTAVCRLAEDVGGITFDHVELNDAVECVEYLVRYEVQFSDGDGGTYALGVCDGVHQVDWDLCVETAETAAHDPPGIYGALVACAERQ